MKVPLLDLKGQYSVIKDEILQAANEVFESQYFILGPRVESLEKEIADYCFSKHAVGVSSGTDALLISLMASDIDSQNTMITVPYTFFATAGSISRVGARPIFVDIDPETYNMSPECLERTIDAMTRAELAKLKGVMPVHLYGQCSDMDPDPEDMRKITILLLLKMLPRPSAPNTMENGQDQWAISAAFLFFLQKTWVLSEMAES